MGINMNHESAASRYATTAFPPEKDLPYEPSVLRDLNCAARDLVSDLKGADRKWMHRWEGRLAFLGLFPFVLTMGTFSTVYWAALEKCYWRWSRARSTRNGSRSTWHKLYSGAVATLWTLPIFVACLTLWLGVIHIVWQALPD